jgi:hypothetical protein
MDHKKFRTWLFEEKSSRTNKNLFVLVGPPAVGKTSWIEQNIESSGIPFIVISRDQIIEDQIFPQYKLTNEELYKLYPPQDSEDGKIIPGMEKYGIVVTSKNGKKHFEQILRANTEIEQLIKKEKDSAVRTINQLPDEQPYNIVIDAINGTAAERQKAISLVKDNHKVKKIAIYFNFKDHEQEIKKRSAERAVNKKLEFGYGFQRGTSDKAYSDIFNRITRPTEAEGFDDVQSVDTFKGVNLEPWEEITAETLTRTFRKYLNEEKKPPKNFGVVKTGSGLNETYALIDVDALVDFYKTLDPKNPNITKDDLINNNVVISAVKIAENTDGMKDDYGPCMDASHVKVSAVNKNLKGHGYGRLLYKIIMSEHPEGLTPDRDFLSDEAKKAWNIMKPELQVKTAGGHDSFEDYAPFRDQKEKEPAKEYHCMLHPRYEGDPLNRAYTYSGENTQFYLMKAHEALATCEEMIPGGWTIESLEDLIVDAGMKLYDLSIGIESLQEARLSKTWRSRAKARARRHDRKYPNKIDRSWALRQQQKWNKENPELEEEYLKELEHAKALTDSTRQYIQKIKELRKKKLEAKRNKIGVVKFGSGTPDKLPQGKTLPDKTVKNKQGVLSKIDRERKKAGGPTISGTGTYGGIALEETEEK